MQLPPTLENEIGGNEAAYKDMEIARSPSAGSVAFWALVTRWYKGYHYGDRFWGYRARAEPRAPGLITQQQSLLSLQVLWGLAADGQARRQRLWCPPPNSTPLVTSIQDMPKTVVCHIHCISAYNVRKSKSREVLACCTEQNGVSARALLNPNISHPI